MFTVLIADDEAIELKYLSSIFNKHPEQCRLIAQAENGEQAVAMAAHHRPDVIIMDISMPLLSGLEAARRIRQQAPGQVIILNSAHTEFEMAHQAVTDQLDAYLLKPASEDAIFATIHTCLGRKSSKSRIAEGVFQEGPVDYPYNAVDQILQALADGENKLLQAGIDAFKDFLDAQNDADRYRLYIINTLFSVEQALRKKDASGEHAALLDGGRAIRQVSHFAAWGDISAVCHEFFVRLLLICKSHAPASRPGSERVAQYIDQHYMEDLSLESLAATVHFSPAYLSRVFHAETGMTLRHYISRRRIEQATYLLQNSDRMLRDIAGDCGFKNLSHFHRVYKEFTGMTPSQAREKGNAHAD